MKERYRYYLLLHLIIGPLMAQCRVRWIQMDIWFLTMGMQMLDVFTMSGIGKIPKSLQVEQILLMA